MTTTSANVAITLRRPTPAAGSPDDLQWSMWIADARMLIRDRLGDLDELDQEKLDYVVREAVAAQVRRPDDATQVDIAIDDGRVSRTYTSGSGRVTIRPEWWTILDPEAEGSGSFTIRPHGAPDRPALPTMRIPMATGWADRP